MALDGFLYKLVWGGILAGTETWSCSLHFISPDVLVEAPAAFKPALTDWMTRPDSNISGIAQMNWIKFNRVTPDNGVYWNPAASFTHFVEPAVYGVAPAQFPNLSSAVSTLTAVARGHAHAGRFYPPSGGSSPVQVDGRMTEIEAMQQAVSAAQLITDLNGSATGECYVWSQIGQIQRPIVGVRVGCVMDTQRRRRRNLIETYQTAPIS